MYVLQAGKTGKHLALGATFARKGVGGGEGEGGARKMIIISEGGNKLSAVAEHTCTFLQGILRLSYKKPDKLVKIKKKRD
jgi:hypothetical protein